MTNTAKTIAPTLRALLEGFIDYAGLFPPAKLPLDQALSNYSRYQNSEHSWMLRWFVVGGAEAEKVPGSYDGALSILADSEQPRAATIESTTLIQSSRPTYVEVGRDALAQLDGVKEKHAFAKIRTGGVKAEAFPSPAEVAAFIEACAARRLPFKATAGLHHPVRSEQPLTYEKDSPRAVMHGFINVLMAAAFAWRGDKDIEPIIAETDPGAFSFGERACWRDRCLTLDEIKDARQNFVHSVGSCSFEEPVHDLRALGWL
ncbi:MAG: hypothetical protein JSS83_24355 [Cyanobacteria bacterium SZAS LIN-3]|nr:hypothetical protein [Cyanobacteria bacterium SZAS LIN-3]MBS2007426.1 hypothetical protein [Cyanobacteria bacterium SZAS TMP-1]